jgi:O-antigen/teichoic acid export membrane protein
LIRHWAIPVYFAIRIASALVLLKLSTQFLTVQGFANFAQFIAFSSLLNMAVVGGAQNGLIREAAAANAGELADVHSAGLAVWAGAAPLVGIPVALFSPQISSILTGSGGYWQVVVALTLLSLAAGPGQVCWSILSGRMRVAQSLGAQSVGILTGTAIASWFILGGNFVAAALAFASGPLVGMFVALPFTARLRLSWRPAWRGVRPLLGYSAAMASTLGFSALVLFALRWVYRGHFGATQLGYWLAANRISDMSTQFLGLFMLQAFVPHLAMIRDKRERSGLILRYGLMGAGLTGSALLAFVLAARPLVHLFLSDAYTPAIPVIRLYMVGDFLRVWGSLAMFTAFAGGKPRRYATIEIGTMSLMAALTLFLIRSGETRAPQLAYAAAWGTTALACAAVLFFGRRQHRAPSRPRGERRISLPGSAPHAL